MKSQNRVAHVCQLVFALHENISQVQSSLLSPLQTLTAFGTATRSTASFENCNLDELILQLEKGCVILKETDTAGKETTELCTESTGILPAYFCLDFTGFL